jgi:hypothetical protein
MSRVVFIGVTVFWLTMNALLWRAEFGSDKSGGAVPVRTVWEKILTAADDSSMTISHHGKMVGSCRWQTGVGEEWANVTESDVPVGLPAKNQGYELRLDGSALVTGEVTNRVRVEGNLRLDKNREWQELNARLNIRPMAWEIHSVAAEQSVSLKMINGDETFQRVFKMADLKNPAALAGEFLGPFAGELLAEAGLPALSADHSGLVLGIQWQARDDAIKFGRTEIQVYRLQTRLLDRYDVSVIVSRAGEILRVELPDEFQFVNDRLGTF